jgi:hypothetical protein
LSPFPSRTPAAAALPQDFEAEIQRLRDGSQVDALDERCRVLQAHLDQKSIDLMQVCDRARCVCLCACVKDAGLNHRVVQQMLGFIFAKITDTN